MDIPRYLYSENIKNDYLQYLKEAREARNDTLCNFKTYDELITLFPLDNKVKQELKTYVENINICTVSDDETDHNCRPLQSEDNYKILNEMNSMLQNSCQDSIQTNIDIIELIRDSLSTQNELSNVIRELTNLSSDGLDKVFTSLTDLSLENIDNFWNSMINSNNDYVVISYVRHWFLPMAKKEFIYELENIFLSLSQKYPTILKNELVQVFVAVNLMDKDNYRVLLQYLGILNNSFKTDVLRCFIYTCDKLYPSYICIIEALLNPESDYDILSKLIEAMSNAVTEFTCDNAYGKLLFNVVNLLENNVYRLEQPLKHILGTHRSIWKIKVQKVITCFEDSLTQSFT